MEIKFYKYNANGNDFIIIDNREKIYSSSNTKLWSLMCNLKFGIGADGVLLLEESTKVDFKMRYINSDGSEVEMCGNGARSITAFADKILDLNKNKYIFETINGLYQCQKDDEWGYRLEMSEISEENEINLSDFAHKFMARDAFYINTGVPHSCFEILDVDQFNVSEHGREVRYDDRFAKGSNANFYSILSERHLKIRTYERGVEAETYSCGTGCVATAIAYLRKNTHLDDVVFETKGGRLKVEVDPLQKRVFLCGRSDLVFEGIFFYED